MSFCASAVTASVEVLPDASCSERPAAPMLPWLAVSVIEPPVVRLPMKPVASAPPA